MKDMHTLRQYEIEIACHRGNFYTSVKSMCLLTFDRIMCILL